jgi:hypothetical protein
VMVSKRYIAAEISSVFSEVAVQIIYIYIVHSSIAQPPGRGPVPASGINYPGASLIEKKNLLGRKMLRTTDL